MPAPAGKTRQDRSSTLPNGSRNGEDKKQRNSRGHGHRHTASQTFSMHRNPAREAREGAHQLGADIANLLNRSAGPSANHSRSASRHPTSEERNSETTSQSKRSEQQAGLKQTPARPAATWDDVRELRRMRQESEQRLRTEFEKLSTDALRDSRNIDSTLHQIQSDTKSAIGELSGLRELSQATRGALAKFTEDTAPAVIREHEQHLTALQDKYDDIEKTKIGELESRLRRAHEKVKGLKTRMERVRDDIADCAVRDAEEMKRSRRRHWAFWTFLSLFTVFVMLVLFPRSPHQIAEKAVTVLERLNQSEVVIEERLRPPPRAPTDDDIRFKIFDEL